jgi:hypothetical protein
MDMNNMGNRIVVILVFIALIVFAWDLGRKQALNSLSNDDFTTTSESKEGTNIPANPAKKGVVDKSKKESTLSTDVSGASLNVADQPAGLEVRVSSLLLTENGWVGIRDIEGRVLGAGRFEAGTFKDVTVPLLRATVAGESYQALLYVDDGDKEFDLHKDILISGPDGGVAGTNFKVL